MSGALRKQRHFSCASEVSEFMRLSAILNLRPHILWKKVLRRYFHSRGLAAVANGQLEAGEAFFLRGLELGPAAGIYLSLGHTQLGLGNSHKAIKSFIAARALMPSDARSTYGLGAALLAAGDYANAAIELSAAAPHFGDDLQLWRSLGSAYHLSGQLKLAVDAWTRGMQAQSVFKTGSSTSERRYLGRYWTSSIGHMALMDFFIKSDALEEGAPPHAVAITREAVANAAYLECFAGHLEFVRAGDSLDPGTLSRLEEYPTVVRFAGEWRWVHEAMAQVQERWDAAGKSAALKLADPEISHARSEMHARFGLPHDAWFVTLHVRDGANQCTRSSEMQNYYPAVELVTRAGGWVVRIGYKGAEGIPAMERVIDYANSDLKEERLDVFLLSQCRFMIGTNSGPCWVAQSFGVPTVLTNWAPLGIQSHMTNSIVIPKLMWSIDKERPLSLVEHANSALAHLVDNSSIENLGCRVIPNSAEDISGAVMQMLHETDGPVHSVAEHDARQAMIREILGKAGTTMRGRMGRQFMEDKPFLLTPRARTMSAAGTETV